MKKLIITLLFLLPLFIINAQEKQKLSAHQFWDKINNKANNSSIVILDVRTADEFNTGHIRNGVQIDYRSKDFSEQIKKLDPNKEYLVYCRSGVRSSYAIDSLKALGFAHIFELEGGINSWKQEKLPLEGVPADKITLDQYNEIIASAPIVLIDFYAPWCGPCLKMTPMFEEIAKKYEGKIKLVKINADENKNLTERFTSKGFPLLIAYKNQTIIWEKVGLLNQDEIEKEIDLLF